jgi:hypothetical protein
MTAYEKEKGLLQDRVWDKNVKKTNHKRGNTT